jgi:hypothetical protein
MPAAARQSVADRVQAVLLACACSLLHSRSPFSVRRSGYELLALKDAPDDALLDQVQAIGVTAARSILYDEAKRLRYTDRQAKMDCIALMNRINELIRPA